MECCSCEEIRAILEDFLTRLQAITEAKAKRTRTKRAPSAYNIFMGECVKELGSDVPIQERFKACAVKYKELKEKG